MFEEYSTILFVEIGIVLVSLILWRLFHRKQLFSLTFVGILCIFFTCYFFRNPDRRIPEKTGLIVSPADGKIVEIEYEIHLPDYPGTYKRIAIYLSIFDVHINRIPVEGKIVKKEYHQGRFYPAFHAEAGEKNESMMLELKSDYGPILIRQIAGIVARRIVCRVSPGDHVVMGQRYGMIKFGSRVELTIPGNLVLRVEEGQKVKAGVSIIAERPS